MPLPNPLENAGMITEDAEGRLKRSTSSAMSEGQALRPDRKDKSYGINIGKPKSNEWDILAANATPLNNSASSGDARPLVNENQGASNDTTYESLTRNATPVSFKPNTEPEQKREEPGLLSDAANLLGIGVDSTAKNFREVVRQFAGESVVKKIDSIDKWFTGKSTDEIFKENDKLYTGDLSKATKEARSKEWWDEKTDSFGSAWSDPRSYMAGLLTSLPEEAVTMFPAMRLGKVAYEAKMAKATAQKLAGGMSKEVAIKEAQKEAAAAAARTATITGSVSEGMLGGAQASRDVREQILGMSPDELKDSEAIQNLMASGVSFDEARSQLANSASTKAFFVAGVATGIFGGQGDRLLAKMMTGEVKAGIGKRVIKGVVSEGVLEEFPQSYASKVGQNLAMRDANPAQPLTAGALNEALGGLAVGSIQGGAIAAVSGKKGGADTTATPDPSLSSKPSIAPPPTPADPARPPNVPNDYIFDETVRVWRQERPAEKAARIRRERGAGTAMGGEEADAQQARTTSLPKDLGATMVKIEQSLNTSLGINMLAAVHSSSSPEQQVLLRNAAARAGVLDEFNSAINNENLLNNGRQLLSDNPEFGSDFRDAAFEYAQTQPEQMAKPKFDERKTKEQENLLNQGPEQLSPADLQSRIEEQQQEINRLQAAYDAKVGSGTNNAAAMPVEAPEQLGEAVDFSEYDAAQQPAAPEPKPNEGSALLRGQEVAPATAVSEVDAHKAADIVTANWSQGAARVEFAPTFSSLPQEIQDSVNKGQQGKAKAIFHPRTNSIWVVMDKHVNRADVEESLYHEGGHWGSIVELGKDAMAVLDRSFGKLGTPLMIKIAKDHGFFGQFSSNLKEYEASGKTSEDRARLVAELIAGVAQKQPYRSWPQKIKDIVKELVGQFRNWLVKNGYTELASLNEADILNLVARSNKRLISGGRNPDGVPAFLITATEAAGKAIGRSLADEYNTALESSRTNGVMLGFGDPVFDKMFNEVERLLGRLTSTGAELGAFRELFTRIKDAANGSEFIDGDYEDAYDIALRGLYAEVTKLAKDIASRQPSLFDMRVAEPIAKTAKLIDSTNSVKTEPPKAPGVAQEKETRKLEKDDDVAGDPVAIAEYMERPFSRIKPKEQEKRSTNGKDYEEYLRDVASAEYRLNEEQKALKYNQANAYLVKQLLAIDVSAMTPKQKATAKEDLHRRYAVALEAGRFGDKAKAKEARKAAIAKLRDRIAAGGNLGIAMTDWNILYRAQKKGEYMRDYRNSRFNDFIAAARAWNKESPNKNFTTLITMSDNMFKRNIENRKNIMYQLSNNKFYSAFFPEFVSAVYNGKAKLDDPAHKVADAIGFSLPKMSEKQFFTFIEQVHGSMGLEQIRIAYDVSLAEGMKQGQMELVGGEKSKLVELKKHLDAAVNGKIAGKDGKPLLKVESIESAINQLNQKIAFIDANLNGEELPAVRSDVEYMFENMGVSENDQRSDLLKKRREAVAQISVLTERGVELAAEQYQLAGQAISRELFNIEQQALADGLPRKDVVALYKDAMQTLMVGLGVKLDADDIPNLFRESSDIVRMIRMNEQLRPAEDIQVEPVQQGVQDDMFDKYKMVSDLRNGLIMPDQMMGMINREISLGNITANEVVEAFKAAGHDIPHAALNVAFRLPVRVRLSKHMQENEYSRVHYEEWMHALHGLFNEVKESSGADVKNAVSIRDVVNELTKDEMTLYNRWRKLRGDMQSRSVGVKESRSQNARSVFEDLLFAKHSLSEVRAIGRNITQDSSPEEYAFNAVFTDPITTWHKDIEYARKTRPELMDQVIGTAGRTDLMVSPEDAAAHAEWLRLRNVQLKREADAAIAQEHVSTLIDALQSQYIVPSHLVEPSRNEKVVYMVGDTEVPSDTRGAVPINITVTTEGLRAALYRAADNERNNMVLTFIKMHELRIRSETDVTDEDMLLTVANEDSHKSKSIEDYISEKIIEDSDAAAGQKRWRKDYSDQEVGGSEDDVASGSDDIDQQMNSWEGVIDYEAEEAAIDSNEPFYYDEHDRLRKGAYSGVVHAAQLKLWVDKITSTWRNAPNITVLGNYLQLPKELRVRIASKLAVNMGAKGLFDGQTNTVYVFADFISSEADAEFTIFHEVHGHYGLRALLGIKFDAFLEAQYKVNKTIRSMADDLIAQGTPKLEAIDEALADISMTTKAPGAVKAFVAKVISGLRSIGFNNVANWFSYLTDAEVVGALEASRRNIKDGNLSYSAMPDVIRLAEARKPYEMFTTKEGKTLAYARYNPLIDQWYLFVSKTGDIRSGDYDIINSASYEDILNTMRHLGGKTEFRQRSARYIDNKIATDFVKIPKISEMGSMAHRLHMIRTHVQNENAAVFSMIEHFQKYKDPETGKRVDRFSGGIDLKTSLTLYERIAGVKVEQYNKRFVKPIADILDRLGKHDVAVKPYYRIDGKEVSSMKDIVNLFLLAEHAKERNDLVATRHNGEFKDGSGMKDADAGRLMRWFAKQPYYAELKEISAKLDELSDFKLKEEVDSGLISQRDALLRKNAYKHYRNLSGIRSELDEDVTTDPSINIGRKFNVRGKDKFALGRSDVAPDILARTLLAGEASVIRAQKNSIAQKALAFFETNYDPNFVTINEISTQRFYNPLTKLVEFREMDNGQFISRDDVLVAKVRGVPIAIRFKETGFGTVAESLTGKHEDVPKWLDTLAKYQRFIGQLITTYNPAWIAINFIRDVQTMYSNAVGDGRIDRAMANEMMKQLWPSMKASFYVAIEEFEPKTAVGKAAKKRMLSMFNGVPVLHDVYLKAREAGGITTFINRKGLEEQITEIDYAINGATGVDAARRKVEGWLKFMELMTLPAEMAPRIAAFKVMQDHGYSAQKAAVFSGEITVNFNMRGANKYLRYGFLFFNPAVQGTAKMLKVATSGSTEGKIFGKDTILGVQNVNKRFGLTVAAWIGFGSLMSIVARAMSGDDEDGINKLLKVPPLKRSTNAIWSADTLFGSFPIAYGYNAFYAMGNFAVDAINGDTTAQTAAARIASTAFESFSPVGSGAMESKTLLGKAVKTGFPTITMPAVEWLLNENRFGSPIYKSESPFGGPRTPDSHRNFDSTNPIATAFARKVNELTGGSVYTPGGIDINPEAIDHIIEGYLPGIPNEVYKFTGVASRWSIGEETPGQKMPFLGRFKADVPQQWDAGAYRRMADKFEGIGKELYDSNISEERKNKIFEKYPDIDSILSQITETRSFVRDLHYYYAMIESDPGKTAEEIAQAKNELRKNEQSAYRYATSIFIASGMKQYLLGD